MEVEKANRAAQNKSGDSDELSEEFDKSKEVQAEAEIRKMFLLSQVKAHVGAFATFK